MRDLDELAAALFRRPHFNSVPTLLCEGLCVGPPTTCRHTQALTQEGRHTHALTQEGRPHTGGPVSVLAFLGGPENAINSGNARSLLQLGRTGIFSSSVKLS